MTFLWPGLLLLITLLPLLVLAYVIGQRRRRPSSVRYSSLVLIRDALPRSSFVRRHLPFVLFAFALAGLAVALARPVVIASVPTNQTTIILSIDVSRSMCSTDIPPSRIQAAEAAATQFIESQGSSTQIGIVAFSGFAEIVQAPTADRQKLLDALQSLTTGRRTAVGSGILDGKLAAFGPLRALQVTTDWRLENLGSTSKPNAVDFHGRLADGRLDGEGSAKFGVSDPVIGRAGALLTIHNLAAQFALSETAQAHLAVEKGDKLGTVIVDCAR